MTAAVRWPSVASEAESPWHESVLDAHLDRVRRLLGADTATLPPAADADAVEREAEKALGHPSALRMLVDGFGLTPFERDVLLAAVAAEVDPGPPPTFALAQDRFPDAHWSSLRPDRPLRAAHLVVLGDGPMVAAPLAVDERIVHHLRGVDAVDERLHPYLTRVVPPTETLPESRVDLARRLADLWDEHPGTALVHGPGGGDRADVVALAADDLGWRLDRVAAADLPRAIAERDAFARLWNREAVLGRSALLVDAEDDGPEVAAAVDGLVRRLLGPVAVSSPALVPFDDLVATFAVDRPTRREQEELWRAVLPATRDRDDVAADLARRFDLDHGDINRAPMAGAEEDGGGVANRGRDRIRGRLDDLAERIEPRAGWEDLVVPAAQRRLLEHLAAAATGRAMAEDEGFGADSTRGFGVSALFAGPSGTGKTLAAEVLAGELGLDLYRIDLASVVSKWIGDTEKHLKRVFDAAEQGGVLLLFDEADAFFGRRSEVRDSHDRYANVEVAYLLQRMERYRGVAVLTTNMRSAIDPAFLRRLRVVVQFAHPGVEERAKLWALAFPLGVRTSNIDWDRVATLDLTGGEIQTVALQSFLAATADGAPVGMGHLREAVAAEFAKQDRPLAQLENWQ